jgi:hypothetical protein
LSVYDLSGAGDGSGLCGLPRAIDQEWEQCDRDESEDEHGDNDLDKRESPLVVIEHDGSRS